MINVMWVNLTKNVPYLITTGSFLKTNITSANTVTKGADTRIVNQVGMIESIKIGSALNEKQSESSLVNDVNKNHL